MMNITLTHHGLDLSDAIRTHVLARFDQALDRFSSRLSRVTIRLKDDNGPKGGEDKVCDLTIEFTHAAKPMHVSRRHEDLYKAVSLAASTAKYRLSRTLGDKKRGRTPS